VAENIAKLDHKVQALVREAEKGLNNVQTEISRVLRNLNKGQVDKHKALAASTKLMSFMKKFIPVTKIQNSPAYGQLAPATQKQVDWMDQLLSDLLGTLHKLKAAQKDAAKTPKKNFAHLIKASEKAYSSVQGAPKGVGTLLKEIKKANDPSYAGAQGIAILPMALILWMILDMIHKNLKRRPKL